MRETIIDDEYNYKQVYVQINWMWCAQGLMQPRVADGRSKRNYKNNFKRVTCLSTGPVKAVSSQEYFPRREN